jgi:calcium-translocating P-type ATPase
VLIVCVVKFWYCFDFAAALLVDTWQHSVANMPGSTIEITKETLAGIQTEEDLAAVGGVEAIAAALHTDLIKGLSSAAVEASRAQYGTNKLPHRKPRSFFMHLQEAFEDTTLKILVASAVFSILFGLFLSDNNADMIQGFAIVVAVVLVSGVNSFQNWSKDREFQSLAAIRAERSIQVIRDGSEVGVSIFDVVVGDVVVLASGDGLPCDGVLLRGYEVEVDQSSMTGEAEPVLKSAAGEGDPILIGGCQMLEGEGAMLATAVGLASKMGQTVSLVEGQEAENTPLQDRLEALAEEIGKLGTAAGFLTFLVLTALWWLAPGPKVYTDLLRFFIVGVTIVVVAVPEGLPLAVTISLAFSMRRMMKDNNLVREMQVRLWDGRDPQLLFTVPKSLRAVQACETMGSATVIASDKTVSCIVIYLLLFGYL